MPAAGSPGPTSAAPRTASWHSRCSGLPGRKPGRAGPAGPEPRRGRARLRPPARSWRRTGRPLTHTEGGMPEAEGPEEDRDEVLNPAMERHETERRRRQMGSRGVDEDTDQDVDHDEKTLCAE